ncbi:MAG TPA: acyl-CoA dehydrogenase family protein [Pseudomonadales bacterium]|nr:acyl-CoA dehydrogenase family protein [Pseudomonadales bacterium]
MPRGEAMDFELPGDDDSRRREVRAWCEAHPRATGMDLAKAGYVVPHWPRPWGLAADAELQLIIDDELHRAGLQRPNNSVAINNCGISLVLHGTKEQQDRYLWPALSGEELWCQLFSEPSSGSDLASLRTQAVRDGDHYVINGSKIWTSLAHKASVGIMVARTDPTARKHKGLSTFIIDMHAPGVEVRPIDDMTGHPNEYNQCFFTDVRVPVGNRIGTEGDGWRISNTQLQTERVALAKPGAIWGSGPTARDLVDGLRDAGALADPLVRQQAAELYIEGEILRLLKYRNLSDRMQGRPLGPESAVQKALSSPHGQRIMALALEWMGPRGLTRGATPFANESGEGVQRAIGELGGWNWGIWFSPAVTLGIGTTEIMKNVIAERLLEMPREDDPDVRKPWNETQRTAS